jgi:hypothetical protein
MASRKPKGIADDIVGGIRNIVSPWLGAPAGQNRSVTQAQGLARSAAETLDQTFAGGMIGAGVKGNKALAKQAGVNAAALGVGYVAGKVAQKVLPIVQAKLGNEIGTHLSDVDKLRNIRFSPERAGTGFKYQGVESGQTYKFSPYSYVGETPQIDPQFISGKVYGRRTMQQLAGETAAENLSMAASMGEPTKKFAYVTKSKPGIMDPDFGLTNAFMVPKQKVNVVRGVTGVATQKTGTKLNNKNKKR